MPSIYAGRDQRRRWQKEHVRVQAVCAACGRTFEVFRAAAQRAKYCGRECGRAAQRAAQREAMAVKRAAEREERLAAGWVSNAVHRPAAPAPGLGDPCAACGAAVGTLDRRVRFCGPECRDAAVRAQDVERARAWQAANPERNREISRASKKRWRAANLGAVRAYNAAYHAARAEELNAQRRQRRAAARTDALLAVSAALLSRLSAAVHEKEKFEEERML